MTLPSEIVLPSSSSTVSVKAFNTVDDTCQAPAALFLEPVLAGRESMASFPVYSFLIEHGSGRRIMFDLGPRKDVEAYPPKLKERFLSIPGFNIRADKDIVEQLEKGGISLESVDTVIWSHTHFDHTGDLSKWPTSTKLVVGPGSDRRGYPSVPDAELLDSDFAGREVKELSFADSKLQIGGRPAIDFFEDGSLYLVDMPGHCPGHIVALARVKPDSFVLLGGDTFHHVGQIRPNEHIHKAYPCPGHILDATRKSISAEHFASPGTKEFDLSKRDTPLLSIPPPPSAYNDKDRSLESQKALGVLDVHKDIFVMAAHDVTLVGVKSYGSPFGTTVKIPKSALMITSGKPKEHVSDTGFHREFCGTCGSGILEYEKEAATEWRYVKYGTLEERGQEVLMLKGEFFVKYRNKWMPEIPDVFHKEELEQ
ncbi:hypothetical protein V5O48_006527 [Marasmius crinis-equi]|uniref:Metallo-beta-lactamase domain-containing protein n=1 Tax=Marasmius crinis-equi TaxID=585013 RepID=A0ABR3FJ86_9AGAR